MMRGVLKTSFLLFISFVACTELTAQVDLAWAKSIGTTSYDHVESVATDSKGNIYTTGSFAGTVDFDPGPGSYMYTAKASSFDGYIMKQDANGSLVWVWTFGDSGEDGGYACTVDKNDNVIFVGDISGSVKFLAGNANATISTKSLSTFVMKVNSAGNLVWVKSLDGNGADHGNAVVTDHSNNIIVGGYFEVNIDLDPSPSNVENFSAYDDRDAFLVKLSENGTYEWGYAFGHSSNDEVMSLAVNSQNGILASGYYQGLVDFDPSSADAIPGFEGGTDMFILSIDSLGSFSWVNGIGSAQNEAAKAIQVDHDDNVITGGYFSAWLDFDPDPNKKADESSKALIDLFVAKYSPSGRYLWHASPDGAFYESTNGIAIGENNEIYAIGTNGNTQAPMDFDLGTGEDKITSAGGYDCFIWSLDSTGNHRWVKSFGSTSHEEGEAVTLYQDDIIFVGGFNGTVDFDPTSATSELVSNGSYDIFLQKLQKCVVRKTYEVSDCKPILSPDGKEYYNTSGVYYDTLTTAQGCDSIVTTVVSIYELDTSIRRTEDSLISNFDNGTYQWLNCNNAMSEIQGATNKFYVPTSSGNYAVRVSENDCYDTSFCVHFEIITEGIGSAPRLFGAVIYPNPFNDKIVLELKNDFVGSFLMQDLTGSIIYQNGIGPNDQRKQIITTNSIANGVYFITLRNDYSIQSLKLVKCDQR